MNKSSSATSGSFPVVDLIFWLCFPVVATLLDIWWKGQPFSPVAALAAQTSEPLLWIIDSIPVILLLWRPNFDSGAKKSAAIPRSAVSTEQQITERTAKLTKQIAELKSQVIYLRQEREELRVSEDLYRNLVDHASDSMFALSPDGTITTTNPQLTTLIGKHRDDLIGRHCSTILPSASLTLVEEQLQRAQRGEKTPTTLTLSFYHQNGKLIEIEVRFLPRVDPQGNTMGLQGICHAKTPEPEIAISQSSPVFSVPASEPVAGLQSSFGNSTLGGTLESSFASPTLASTPASPALSLTPSFYEDSAPSALVIPVSAPPVPVLSPTPTAPISPSFLSPSPVLQSPQPPVGVPAEQILDLDAALSRVDGDRELLVEMADLFLDEYPRLLSTLRDAVAQGNAPTAAYAAHTLKGSVANFSAMPAVTAAQKIERIARQGDLTHVHSAFADLEVQLNRLKPVLLNLKIGVAA